MSFDLLVMQQQILDRLATLASPVPIVDTLTRVDLTDESVYPAGVHTFYSRLAPTDQVGRSTVYGAQWSFDLYVDTGRVTEQQKTAAFTLFSDALRSLVGWEITPGNPVHASAGQESATEGRNTRISFGFTIPVYMAG